MEWRDRPKGKGEKEGERVVYVVEMEMRRGIKKGGKNIDRRLRRGGRIERLEGKQG